VSPGVVLAAVLAGCSSGSYSRDLSLLACDLSLGP
jgi:hypothetical protein